MTLSIPCSGLFPDEPVELHTRKGRGRDKCMEACLFMPPVDHLLKMKIVAWWKGHRDGRK